MKIKFTPVVMLMLCLLAGSAQSPITITTADMPTSGYTASFAKDTPLTSVNYGNAGANQTYNFSSLTNTITESAAYTAPTGPQQTSFPNANLVVSANGASIMLNNSSTKYLAVGAQGRAFGVLTNTKFSPTEQVYQFPTQYQGTFRGSWAFVQAFDAATAGVNQPFVDSVRLTFTDKFSDIIDGWGKVITPVGSYRGLREKRIDTTVENYDYYSFGSWSNYSSTTNRTTEYTYLAKETKGAVVSFDYDSAGNIKSVKYSLTPPSAPIAGFSAVTSGSGLVTFTDTSEGFPTRYHWNFGDGDTANTANPTHTYSANGTYYVCETVYNPSGNNTVCDSVRITTVGATHVRPVTVNDTAIDIENQVDLINVTANDHSPSSDAFCVTRVYGSTYFTVSGCNSLSFTPANNYTGFDTVYYVVCNTGQPTLCDTGRLIVDVVKQHVKPVAVADNTTTLQPATDIIHVTANDYSPSADSFCITSVYGGVAGLTILNCGDLSFQPDSAFTGNDTAFYVICNTGQPTLCDTGILVVTVQANSALLPVADLTLTQIICGGLRANNTSTNEDSLVWNFHALQDGISYPDTTVLQAQQVQYGQFTSGTDFQVCLTAYNRFGNETKCDTMYTICEGIQEEQVAGITMYPNPANTYLTIDMRNNNAIITRKYSGIVIYNALGQKSISTNKEGAGAVLTVRVDELPAGIYLATIVDAAGSSSVLGKFTVVK